MFSEGKASAELSLAGQEDWENGRRMESSWFEYEGPDCAPFTAYMRFSKNMLIISQIIGRGRRDEETSIRKGRMPKIMNAASTIYKRIRVESVLSPTLRDWLLANDFKSIDETWPNYEKTFE
jgi:hypothetical protein